MKDTKQQWFKEAKYGLFIHWGLYSVLAGEYKGRATTRIAEWIMNDFDIPRDDYELLAKEFNPVDFDADMIAKKAKDWGMKYIVFTAKHHDGFAMYDSKCSDYNVVKATPYGKDVLKELQLACEKYGLKLGLYYSQAQDWHDPNGFEFRKENSHKDFQLYLDTKAKPQLQEILTEYGEIGLVWFDTPMDSTPEQSQSIYDLVKWLQPNCIVSGRIGNELGEYMTTADNFIPRLSYNGDWEVPATLNDTWGFNKFDNNWKSPQDIIRLSLKIASRGGNYLLNIGPDWLGNIPEQSIKILDEVGNYIKENAEGIFGTHGIDYYSYEPIGLELTQKPQKLFVHVLTPRYRVELFNIGNKITNAYLLHNKEKLEFVSYRCCEDNGLIEVELPEELHHRAFYCVCLEYEEQCPIFELLEGEAGR
jgi:alpha-L-fucosidase